MKLGPEKNKIILLGVLTAVAGYSVYTQLLSGPAPAPRTASAAPGRTVTGARPPARRSAGRPGFGGSEEPLDPMTVDPTLRTDLLATVRAVAFDGVERNIFRFGERKKPQVAGPSAEEVKTAQERLAAAAKSPKPVKVAKPAAHKPTAPPIKWKYYGFANSSKDLRKRAFLIGDEDQVFIATEGDIFKKRYRVVRIGVNSIVIEDLQFKDQQSLPLEQS